MSAAHAGRPSATADAYRQAGYWAGQTFDDLLAGWARQWPDRTALVDGDRSWTYAGLRSQAAELARGLRRLGLDRGDRVLLQLPNRAEFVLLWFALQRVGAIPVHAMPAHRESEIRSLLRESGAVAYVVPDRHQRFDYRPMAEHALHDGGSDSGSLRHVIVLGDTGGRERLTGFAELGAAGEPAPERDAAPPRGPAGPAALAALLLSGGTTGRPKLIPRTHDDYAYNARAAAALCGLDGDSVYLAALPVGFNFAFACPGVLGTLTVGGTVVIAPDPSPQTAFPLVERHGVTVTALSPALVPHWREEHALSPRALRSLRVLQVGGARLPDEVAGRVGPELGVTLQQVFGMAEGLVCVTRLDDPPETVSTTQGRPISPADEIRIVDTEGRDVPEGEQGELLTRGPYTLRGYYRAPEHDARAFTPDGFYVTGDLVRRLPTGHLVVTGRVKDQINRGGEKIAAVEVEEHLAGHPAVRQAALVAAPDGTWGERAVAFLVCDPAAQPPSRRDLAGFLRQRGLSAHKAPDQVVTVDRLPLTPVGKVDKQALARGLAEPAERNAAEPG